jgi:CheY-like chemotaxis protein/signal transduction histidine kinase/CHASE3 domain sensor protein
MPDTPSLADGENSMAAQQSTKRYSWLVNLPGRYKILVAICPLLALLLFATLGTLYSLQQQELRRVWSQHTYDVLLTIGEVREAQQAAVTAERGYVLTLDSAELAAFTQGKQQFAQRITRLRQLTSDNPLEQIRIDNLRALAASWQRSIEQDVLTPLQGAQQNDSGTSREQRLRLFDAYRTNRKVSPPDIDAALRQMTDTEQSLLDTRNAAVESTLRALRLIAAFATMSGLLFGVYVIRTTTRLITDPLRQITDMMNRVAARDTSVVVTRLGRKDEIGELARALQVFKQMSLDTDAQNLIKTQVTGISNTLLQATTHKEFAQWLTGELGPMCKVGLALFYSFDDTRQRLDLLGSYGLRLGNRSADHFMPGEGLVGQCAVDRRPIILDDVPTDYFHIDSGGGEALPRHIAILPLLYRDTLIGMLELASFGPFTPFQLQLLDELLPIVALALENLNRAISTHDLLLQTQEQADELRVSELLMRQQKDVLHKSNDALHAKTRELQEQSQRLIASDEELRVQAEELQASNEELCEKTQSLNQQRLTLDELQKDTEFKATELARASQYKSEFLANMSHELRTPLNSLLILSRSLADNDTGNLDGEQIESARIIHDAGTSLLYLINDILDLSKIEAGKMELMIDELPIADLLQRLRRTFNHVAEEKGLGFNVELEPGLPPILRTDGNKLEQVANNLLSNAFKFTAKGTVTVRIGRPGGDIDIPAPLREHPLIAITVIDSGIGIPADKFQGIFNAFEQVDAGTSRQFGGTGLGLAISRRIAMLMGGDITVHSESGRGSRFTLLLPERAPESSHEPSAVAPRTDAPALARPRSPHLLAETIADDRDSLQPGDTTILVIEDDAAFARILIDMIHRKGYRALAASDGESGLQLARAHLPTGIVLDVMLPAMDGWTVMDQLKSEPRTRAIPVHFISATDDATRGLELGAVGFLTKPVSRESISAAFERILHFSEGQQRRLLIVDDEPGSRTAIRTMLRAENVLIDEAGSAEEALQKTGVVRYDCMVLDLGLPGISGLELLEQLSKSPEGVPPVVVYSGRDLSREENLALRQYTDSIVVKGARSPERLLDEVSLFLHSIQHAPRRTEAGKAALGTELAGRRVLLVDDDMRNLFALSKVLRGWGLVVSVAQDGQKALRMLDDEAAPELVLMDIMMPVMDGYETMRAIRTQTRYATLPIIALTAKAMRGDRELCLEAGASDYLSKPIDIDKLASMIRVWLQH